MSTTSSFLAAVTRAFGTQSLRPADGRVLVACSGGPDSMSLVAALHALQARLSLTLFVASVDHHFRAASAKEADAVVDWARARNLVAAKLDAYPAQKTQSAARAARYRALGDFAIANGVRTLAVAHTASDQAETLLDRMLRGAGVVGLGAMAPSRVIGVDEFGCASPLTLIRPLLDVTRVQVEAFVAAAALPVARDPSNGDAHYRRARLRAEILPTLRRERADADLALTQLAARLRGSADIIAYATRAAIADVQRDDHVALARLQQLPSSLQAEVLRALCPFALAARHVRALLALCASQHGTQSLDLPGGHAIRTYDEVRFVATPRPAPTPAAPALAIHGPGTYPFLNGTVHISPTFFAQAPAPLTLRPIRPGDRYHCLQLDRAVRLQNLLVNEKIARHRRQSLPALAAQSRTPASPDSDNNDADFAPLLWVGGVARLAHPEISWRPL